MPTTTELDPNFRGHQPDNYKRWERAKQSAIANPTHASSVKYFSRVAAADLLAEMDKENERHGWLHMRKPRSWTGETEPTFDYQTCSTRCAMLRLQLDLSATGLTELHEAVTHDPGQFVVQRPADSKRRGVCKVCGGPVPAT